MYGPFDRIDAWLDGRFTGWNLGTMPVVSRIILQFVISVLLFLAAVAIILLSFFLSSGSISPTIDIISAGWAVSGLAVISLLLVIFMLGYMVHLLKRWYQVVHRGESHNL